MPEVLTIRQRIWNAVKTRFQEIRTANGYQTDIGANCYSWRDSSSPFSDHELPGFIVRDPDCETEHGQPVLGRHQHTLTVEVVGVSMTAAGAPPDNFARHMIGDIVKAIGLSSDASGRQWIVEGVKLANDTIIVSDKLFVEHAGKRVAGCMVTFKIVFQTRQFDPYTL